MPLHGMFEGKFFYFSLYQCLCAVLSPVAGPSVGRDSKRVIKLHTSTDKGTFLCMSFHCVSGMRGRDWKEGGRDGFVCAEWGKAVFSNIILSP